jgi:SAM-dependent methyltransferase
MTLTSALEWDYTDLADTYDLRADYSAELIRRTLSRIGCQRGAAALEVGAGTGKLTSLLCDHGLDLTALEPNQRMREVAFSKGLDRRARWFAARGEALPVKSQSCELVAFGSSFNVLPAPLALDECARVLKPGGHWLAIWNHRDLDDPLQREVEALIRSHLPGYELGRRRHSPEPDLHTHGCWHDICADEERFIVEISKTAWMEAWQSHATLRRQAGPKLAGILAGIEQVLGSTQVLAVPYISRLWTARL